MADRPARRRGGDAGAHASAERGSSPSRPGAPSSAALGALLLFAWGESLLAYDWLSHHVFEPRGRSPLVVALPFFAASVAAAGLAIAARSQGRRPLGGARAHALGLASGLLALTALCLALWLGPRLQEVETDAMQTRAQRQIEDVASALARRSRVRGGYPVGDGARVLRQALVPDYLPDGASLLDPWGHDLEYRSLSEGRGYALLSSGRDGEQDLPMADYIDTSRLSPAGNDIVVINGDVLGQAPSAHAAPAGKP